MSVVIIPDDPKLDPIGFDSAQSEATALTSTVTTNPVESGSVVNDHVLTDPRTFSCVVLVSNQPITTTFEGEGGSNVVPLVYLPDPPSLEILAAPSPPKPPTATPFTLNNPQDRIKRVMQALEDLKANESLVTVESLRRTHESMKLVSIEEPGTEEHLGRITLKFQEIRIVTSETVKAPNPKEERGKGTTDKGSQNPDPFANLLPSWVTNKNGQSLAVKLATHAGLID